MKNSVLKIILAVTLVTGLTACKSNEYKIMSEMPVQSEQLLSGRYTSQNYLNQISYTFDKNKNVTIRFYSVGFSVYSQTGKYEISEDGELITFYFSEEESSGLEGTFSFRREDDCIWIGTICYQSDKKNTSTETEESSEEFYNFSTENIQINLLLPEQYCISYEIREEYAGISRTYIQSMTVADNGIFLDLGDSGEKYIFEKSEDNKYTEYRYNSYSHQYDNPMTVDSNVVAGYTSRVDNYFDFYNDFKINLNYQGNETVGSFDCQKYTSSYETVWGEQSADFWIEPDFGLCVKGVYQYQGTAGITGTKTFLCSQLETESISLPDYN